jgi:hypothetical protein
MENRQSGERKPDIYGLRTDTRAGRAGAALPADRPPDDIRAAPPDAGKKLRAGPDGAPERDNRKIQKTTEKIPLRPPAEAIRGMLFLEV